MRRYHEGTGTLSEPVVNHDMGSATVADPRAWTLLDSERLVTVAGGRVTFIDVPTGRMQELESHVAPDRVAASGAVLRDGSVLVVGGLAGSASGEAHVLAQAEVIIPARWAASR